MSVTAEQVAEECVRQSGAGRFSKNARLVAMVAIAKLPEGEIDLAAYRAEVRKECKDRYGSVLLLIVLPILVNLVTAWIIRWMTTKGLPLKSLRSQAQAAL